MGKAGTGKPIRVGTTGMWRARWTDELGKRHSKNFVQKTDATFYMRERELAVEKIRRSLAYAPADMPRVMTEAKSESFATLKPAENLTSTPHIQTPTERPPETFNELADYWIAKRAIRKRDKGYDDRSMIKCHLRPAFGPLPIRNIGIREVDEYQAKRLDLDKKTVANQLGLLISMLRLAKGLKSINEIPEIKKPHVSLFKTDYSYLRGDVEVQRFLRAAREEREGVYEMFAFALYTGTRAGEQAGLKKDAVDLKNRIITIKNSFAGPVKTDEIRHIPILDPLLEILPAWLIKTSGPLVFTNEDGQMWGESARIFKQIFHRVLDRAGFPTETVTVRGKKRKKYYIRYHDLRHTFASWWVTNGGDIDRLRRILGHKSQTMTVRYAHLAPSAFKSDYARLGTTAPGLSQATLIALPNQS